MMKILVNLVQKVIVYTKLVTRGTYMISDSDNGTDEQ
jgi:hypothetical protein